jgi:hypothetical protein
MKRKITATVAMSALVALFSNSCTTQLGDMFENRAPVLVKTIADVSTKVNIPITITLRHVEAYDEDGDAMSVVLGSAANYTVTGTTVTPALDYIGDLYVPVTITDGVLSSQQKVLIVSVVSSIELFPLITGSWWEYRDSVPANDSVFVSRMEATYLRDTLVAAVSKKIIALQWTNLAEYGVIYEAYTDANGMVLLGGKSPSDTIYNPQLLYRYPIQKGDSWSYTTLNYNATDSVFYLAETATLTCTDTLAYVTVPAGIFECIEMTLTYAAAGSSKSLALSVSTTGIQKRSAGTVVEKLYYSPGVGYVKNITTVNGSVVWLKELTGYFVEEEI